MKYYVKQKGKIRELTRDELLALAPHPESVEKLLNKHSGKYVSSQWGLGEQQTFWKQTPFQDDNKDVP